MDTVQCFYLEQAQRRIGISDGELMQCARTIAHNECMQSFAELSYAEASELIGFLDIYERDQQMLKMRQEAMVA